MSLGAENAELFFKIKTTLTPTVELVFNDVKLKMNNSQINSFIKTAGYIVWDKAKAYAAPAGVENSLQQRSSNGDSVVVLPVVLSGANNVNAALVVQIDNSGLNIIYSTHYKSHYRDLPTTPVSNSTITARELYSLGISQLDFEVFGHKKFLISDQSKNFGQQTGNNITGTGDSGGMLFIHAPENCVHTYSYSSATVFPPVQIWSYTASCTAAIQLPPAIFLLGLDESYGFANYNSVPVGDAGAGGASPYSLEYSNFFNSLSPSQQAFLDDMEYNEYYQGFLNYLILHQFSQLAKNKIIWSINHLLSRTTLITNFSDFEATYLNDFPSLNFMSQSDQTWLNNYPYLKSRIFYFLQNSFVINAHQKVQFHINKMRTESTYFTFNSAYSSYSQYKDLWFNDDVYLYGFGGTVFGDWALNYLMQNSTVPIETFQNQFMGISEGYDNNFDELFWENSVNTFPPQNLPTWVAFEAAYPKTNGQNMAAPDVFDSVGGQIKTMRDNFLVDNNPDNDLQNACALRLSRALNYSGITIPNIPHQTFRGADSKYYFLGAANLNRWMRKTFGCANPNTAIGEFYNSNASHFNTSQIGQNGANLPALLSGKKGIYTIVTKSSWASGHCDMLYDNATCIGSCHFDAPTTIYYCDVWDLN